MKKIFSIVIILLFVGMSLSTSTGFNLEKHNIIPRGGKTLYVGGSGPGNYTKIQDAINDAVDGDTVYVYDDSSSYYEGIKINKSINLIGENRDNTEILNWEDYTIILNADKINISGFQLGNYDFFETLFINSSYNSINNNNFSASDDFDNYVGIKLSNHHKNNTISDNYFYSHGLYSIYILNNCTNTTILNNTLRTNWHDIVIRNSCHNTTIIGNKIIDTGCCAVISIEHSNNNVIKDNILNPSWYFGISLFNSHNNNIRENTIIDGYGVEFLYSDKNKFFENTIMNSRGMEILHSSNNSIISNNIMKCSRKGIKIKYNSTDNLIYHNNFVSNSQNAYDEEVNIWNDSYPSGGNFWDDYNGTDEDGDGIGDTPYMIPGGENQDYYPLMKPYDNDTIPPITTISTNPSGPNGDNGWYISTINVKLKAKDNSIFGIKAIYYRVNGGEWKNHSGGVVNFVLDYNCLINGSIEYYAVDYAGNQEEINVVYGIDIDQLPPEIEVKIEAYKENLRWFVKFTIIAEDSCSGLDRVEFFINDGLQEIIEGSGPEYIFIIQWSKSLRNHVFYFYCYDRAGNVIVASVNGSEVESYPDNYFVFLWKWLDRYPLLNKIIIHIMERWSI
jgi:parallel beta-helix repeat protein